LSSRTSLGVVIPVALLLLGGAARSVETATSHYLQGLQHAEDGESGKAIDEMRLAWQLDSTAAEIPRELARLLLEADRPDEAVPPVQRAIALSPNDPEAHWLLGQILLQKSRPAEAVTALRRAWELDPGQKSYLVTLILALEANGEPEEALRRLDPAQGGVAPDSPYLFMRRGLLRGRLGQAREALLDFLEAIKLAPGYPGAADHLLAICWRLGPSNETASACAEALELEPARTELRRELARILITLGRQVEAIPHLERLHAEDPRDAGVSMQLGVIRFSQERLAEAIELFTQVRGIDPSLPDTDDWLWRALNRADSLQAALRLADVMVARSPNDRRAHWYHALSLAQLGRNEEALAALSEVLRLAPNDRDAGLLAAMLFEELGRMSEARARLERLLELRSDDREVLFRLARVEEKEGQVEAALGWLRRLLEAHPDDANALNEAGYLCADNGIHLEQALDWATGAVALDGDNAAYVDSFGWALYRLGRYAEAITQLERAAKLAAQEPEIRIHLAKAFRGAGRVEEGRRVLRELLAEQPHERRAWELLQLWGSAEPDSVGNPR